MTRAKDTDTFEFKSSIEIKGDGFEVLVDDPDHAAFNGYDIIIGQSYGDVTGASEAKAFNLFDELVSKDNSDVPTGDLDWDLG